MITDAKYTGRDVVTIRNDILDFIKNNTSKWTDFNESDLGMVLVEAVAGVSDMLNYYLDNQALETYLATARQRKNIQNILETMNYKLENVGSAKGEVTFSLVDIGPESNNLSIGSTIPKYTRISTVEYPMIEYLTSQDCVIAVGSTSVACPVTQGIKVTLKPTAEELKEGYKYYLPEDAILLDSVTIKQGNVYWERIEDAFLDIYSGMKYSVHLDSDNRTYIFFTFDYRRYLPTDLSETLEIVYIQSLGTSGVVGPLKLRKIMDSLLTAGGEDFTAELAVTNFSRTYGAYDSPDLTLEKSKARNLFKTMDRYITLPDYDAGIQKYPSILKSYTADWQSDKSLISQPNLVKSWVVTTDLKEVSQVLLDDIAKEVRAKGISIVSVNIVPAEFVDVPIKVTFTLRGSNELYRASTLAKVKAALEAEFKNLDLNLGETITVSRVSQVVKQVSGDIKTVTVLDMNEPIYLKAYQFPIITEVTATLVGDYYGQA